MTITENIVSILAYFVDGRSKCTRKEVKSIIRDRRDRNFLQSFSSKEYTYIRILKNKC